MDIRKAIHQDHRAMLSIWSEYISKTCFFLTTAEIKRLEKVFKDKYLVDPEIECFVQFADAEILSFACIKGKELFFSPLDPRLFGKGFDERMLEYLFREQGINTTYVYCSDMHSLAFYSGLGFVIEDKLEDKLEDIFFDNPYKINKLKLSMEPKEAADILATKNQGA